MARHMRARGQRQTLGTAAALLTAQALQRGHPAAKWLLQSPAITQQQQQQQQHGGGSTHGPLAVTVQLPDDVVESCLLGRGSPVACMQKLIGSSSAAAGALSEQQRPHTSTANIVLAGLAAQGHTQEAFQLFEWMRTQQAQQGQQAQQAQEGAAPEAPPRRGAKPAARAPPRQRQQRPQQRQAFAPNWWTHQLLLFAALNAPREQQLELTLQAVKEARWVGGWVGGWVTDQGVGTRRLCCGVKTFGPAQL